MMKHRFRSRKEQLLNREVKKADEISKAVTVQSVSQEEQLKRLDALQMPGFFFHPRDSEGLERLTKEERYKILENQGNYTVSLYTSDPLYEGDLEVACTNNRIPTHRVKGAVIPEYGNVPSFLI